MRIGVLEWASCGGAVGAAKLPESIRQEGWAMCQALIGSLLESGHECISCVESDLLNRSFLWGRVGPLDASQDVRQQWLDRYSSCDCTLIVAPESDGILTELVQWFEDHNLPTCNCDAEFIQAVSDKWLTAQALHKQGLAHPPTALLGDLADARVLDQFIQQHFAEFYVIKPRDGVGCDGIERITRTELQQPTHADQARLIDENKWIVQPWIAPGPRRLIDTNAAHPTFSRAALVSSTGHMSWLPIVSQKLSVDRRVVYQGGRVMPELFYPGIDELLTQAIQSLPGRARGWVGVDFLWSNLQDLSTLTIIEINPRLTTSFVGLVAAGARDLAIQIVHASKGTTVTLPKIWQSVEFNTLT